MVNKYSFSFARETREVCCTTRCVWLTYCTTHLKTVKMAKFVPCFFNHQTHRETDRHTHAHKIWVPHQNYYIKPPRNQNFRQAPPGASAIWPNSESTGFKIKVQILRLHPKPSVSPPLSSTPFLPLAPPLRPHYICPLAGPNRTSHGEVLLHVCCPTEKL